ncbi:2TM domain-containing protein [Dyadobacter fermentans]|uniref:2TM domain-containing protein n=1 Tax=Dyadobacter fermentans (strain ATCC 700827 / DSM 18053 / CIP 107007 / KCTC 52180 / NS114) TaxID=471854 RepID=C6W5U3_DYAFD|nr:2TM domain-containing protein [Dyadobacter fermentans]ACT96032.1 conserved hypothetical protein [Dyadobacter fermentans DSM 18053]
METPRNEFLWRKAKKRAGFKMHLRTYLIVNAGLWLIYLVSTFSFGKHHVFPWPVFPMLGWGIGLIMHYFTAYSGLDEKALAEKEYDKLIRG